MHHRKKGNIRVTVDKMATGNLGNGKVGNGKVGNGKIRQPTI